MIDLAIENRIARLVLQRAAASNAFTGEMLSRMLAALPLGAGRAIADPFEPTASAVALLELRRDQLAATDGEPRRARGLRGLLRGRLSHA